jgi:general stress protein 26
MDLKKTIFDQFKPLQTVYLATSQWGRPFIRPVILIYQADRFWIATGTDDKKVGQIRTNPQIEFCLPITEGNKNGYIRGSGDAVIIKSPADRQMIFNEAHYIHNYWESHLHPGFTLLRLDLKEMEYMKPGKNSTETIRLI